MDPIYLETPLKNFIAVFWRTWVVLLAPFLLSPLLFISLGSDVGEALRCAYTILLMAAYWLTEALPLPITSMIPMVLLPMLGVMSTGIVSTQFNIISQNNSSFWKYFFLLKFLKLFFKPRRGRY